MQIVEAGHIYRVNNLESEGSQEIVFIRRSSGAIQHPYEHAGTNSQELMRVLIDCVGVLEDRTEYLDAIKEAVENDDCAHYLAEAKENLRKAMLCYEGRAYRRKLDKVNKTEHVHESFRERDRDLPFDHLGFRGGDPVGIENLPVGKDGHILVE